MSASVLVTAVVSVTSAFVGFLATWLKMRDANYGPRGKAEIARITAETLSGMVDRAEARAREAEEHARAAQDDAEAWRSYAYLCVHMLVVTGNIPPQPPK